MRSAEYYQGRADEARIVAEHIISPQARQGMLDCVRDFEWLARLAADEQKQRAQRRREAAARGGLL